MRQKPGTRKSHGEKVVKDIRRATRKQYSAEEKIRIVLDGLKGEDRIAEYLQWQHYAEGIIMLPIHNYVVETILLPPERRNHEIAARAQAFEPHARGGRASYGRA